MKIFPFRKIIFYHIGVRSCHYTNTRKQTLVVWRVLSILYAFTIWYITQSSQAAKRLRYEVKKL